MIILFSGLLSCKKDFLNKKPDNALLVPSTLSDFQTLLDNRLIMNVAPFLNLLSSGDWFTTDAALTSTTYYIQTSYIWAKDIYQGNTVSDWSVPYQQVLYSNIVLDGLSSIKPDSTTQAQYNLLKGSALFYRAFAFYNLAQEFAAPYNPATSGTDLGVPIRLTSDVTIKSERGALQKTYDQIISDLTEAANLLPTQTYYKTRPSKPATLALLARVYQTMQQYDKAQSYATSCLQLYNKLIDYNTLTLTAAKPLPNPLPNANDEVLYYAQIITVSYLGSPTTAYIDTTLYKSYKTNDLRKAAFFSSKGNNLYVFKGTYSGNAAVFTGVATDEVYLIRAECYARQGNTSAAMTDLNTLLAKRYSGTYIALTASSSDDALNQVLTERRKELVYRNLRWTDLRRLNQDTRFAVTLTHIAQGITYTLQPNDKRYVFAIPDNEILSSGIQQNER